MSCWSRRPGLLTPAPGARQPPAGRQQGVGAVAHLICMGDALQASKSYWRLPPAGDPLVEIVAGLWECLAQWGSVPAELTTFGSGLTTTSLPVAAGTACRCCERRRRSTKPAARSSAAPQNAPTTMPAKAQRAALLNLLTNSSSWSSNQSLHEGTIDFFLAACHQAQPVCAAWAPHLPPRRRSAPRRHCPRQQRSRQEALSDRLSRSGCIWPG